MLKTTRSQGSTLMPRLEQATSILESAIAELDATHSKTARISGNLYPQQGIDASVLVDAVSVERLAGLAFESAQIAYCELQKIESMKSIAVILPSVILIIRAAGAQSHKVEPDASAMLCEAAGILGSVAIDAALIERTHIHYDTCVGRSTQMLERAKLIVDSKLSELYPKLDLTRLGSTWA